MATTDAVTVTVRIENHYEDGHRSEHDITAPAPADASPDVLQDWFDYEVWPHTGDGHSTTLHATYYATITHAAEPALVGLTHEWS